MMGRDKLTLVSPAKKNPEQNAIAGAEQIDDDSLMLLVAAGHKDAFTTLVRRHQPLILGYTTQFLANETIASELTQEVFLVLWEKRSLLIE